MKRFLVIFLIGFLFPSWARVYINVGQANVKKSLIAISPLVYTKPDPTILKLKHGEEISKQIKQNLKNSGYFNIIPSGGFIENPTKIPPFPYPEHPQGFRWENWKLISTEFLMFTRYAISNDQKITLRVFLYDILLRKKVFRKEYEASVSQSVSLAHVVCNDIILKLTKKPGIFLTKIAVIRNFKKSFKKELFVMNWDGSNMQQRSYHRSIVLAPAWHPSGTKMVYTAFLYRKSSKGRKASILLYDFKRKRRRILSSYYGTNLGADFFPSGREMLMTTSSKYGGMNIFKYNLRSNKMFPIQLGPRGAINVEPSINQKGNQIVFSSDRSGKVMLYKSNQFGEKVKRITFVGNFNSTPSWSPDGKKIIFSGYSRRRFDLFIMNSTGSANIKRLTTARRKDGKWSNNESPSFSPDGRQIVFVSDRSGYQQIYTMNTDGSNIKRLTFDKYNYKNPKWSPLIRNFFQH